MMCIAAAGCSSIALFSDAVQFAFLESFLIHYRNMRDFLYPADAGPDDIIAAHFVAPGSWTYKRKDWQEISDLETERLNKALAHLSYKHHEEDLRIYELSNCSSRMPWFSQVLLRPED